MNKIEFQKNAVRILASTILASNIVEGLLTRDGIPHTHTEPFEPMNNGKFNNCYFVSTSTTSTTTNSINF
jgi:hypothetical protein